MNLTPLIPLSKQDYRRRPIDIVVWRGGGKREG
jgi:hypothetical protein